MESRREATGRVSYPNAEFDALCGQTYSQVYRIAYRMTGNREEAEDLTQDAFVKAYRYFAQYKREYPFLRWLVQILTHCSIEQWRRRSRRIQSLSLDHLGEDGSGGEGPGWQIADVSADPERMLLDRSFQEAFLTALEGMPQKYRMAVLLCDVEGLSYREIALRTGTEVGTVRSRIHRGRKALRRQLRPSLATRCEGRAFPVDRPDR